MFAGVRTALLSAKAPAAPAAPATPTNHVLNGTFPGDDTTNVTLQSPLNVSGGLLHMANTTGFTKNATFAMDATPPAGTVCTVEFDVSNYVAAPSGTAFTIGGGIVTGQVVGSNGHKTYSVTSTGSNANAVMRSTNNSNYDVANFKCSW